MNSHDNPGHDLGPKPTWGMGLAEKQRPLEPLKMPTEREEEWSGGDPGWVPSLLAEAALYKPLSCTHILIRFNWNFQFFTDGRNI